MADKPARKSRISPLAPITGTAFDWVRIEVPCSDPKCNKSNLQSLRQLVTIDHTTCRSCRAPIDLTIEPWRSLVAHAAEDFKRFKVVVAS